MPWSLHSSVNAVLMGLGPVGYALHIEGLMLYRLVYYFVLFAFEIIIWWIPYCTVPAGSWRSVYNFLLSCAMSSFEPGDALNRWLGIFQRIHARTVFVLPRKQGRIVPNLEHVLLHAWTLVTALATLNAYHFGGGA